jgi:Ser/Thr protein kinase RdoA (MazF antagonist)
MSPPWKAVLDRYPASVRPISRVEPLGNAGGLSGAGLWRFASGRGPLVLRRWPIEVLDRDRLEIIHAWLASAGDLGFVPVPVPSLDGRTIVAAEGRLWELAPWMPGEADLSRPPGLDRLKASFVGLGSFLARLGSSRSEGPSPGLASRVFEIDRLLLGEFEAIRAILDQVPADPCLDLARRWLKRAVTIAPELARSLRKASARSMPIQPCLRDARPDHFLFEGNHLTGLIDFGAMGRDSVAGDLARLLAEWVGSDRLARAEALAAFDSVRQLNELESLSIEAFESANALLGAARWVRWHFFDHRQFEDPEAVVRGLRRGLERLDETFGMVSGS